MNDKESLPISHCPNCRVGLRFDRSIKAKVRCPKCNYSGRASTYSIEGACPYCGQKGLVKNEKASKVVCPHCRQSTTVDRFLGLGSDRRREMTPPAMHPNPFPPIPSSGAIGDCNAGFPKTQINIGAINNMRPGSLTLVGDHGGKWFGSRSPIMLTVGRHTFGRSSSVTSVDVQLPTADTTISKKHFCIEMIVTDRGELQHRLSDAGSTNGTYCNDQRVNPGEIIFLTPGNLIRVGNTVLKFDII